jgi:hypothetical protein
MKFMLALAAAPAILLAIATPRPATIVAKPVQVENVTARRMDESSFLLRWSEVARLPPTTVTEPLLIVHHEGAARNDERQTVGATVSARPRQVRAAALVKRHFSDICSRHGMRKVTFGKRWRCRR